MIRCVPLALKRLKTVSFEELSFKKAANKQGIKFINTILPTLEKLKNFFNSLSTFLSSLFFIIIIALKIKTRETGILTNSKNKNASNIISLKKSVKSDHSNLEPKKFIIISVAKLENINGNETVISVL